MRLNGTTIPAARGDNNAIIAQLLGLGTHFVDFVGYNAFVGTESSIEAIQVTEWDEPQAVLGKPNPVMLQGVMKRHGLRADELGVVGDRIYTDIAMAHAAGAMGILVLSGETTREQAISADAGERPDLVVSDVGELGDEETVLGHGQPYPR